MDNPDTTFMEGYLCPICKEDYFSPDDLLSHFEEHHAEQDFVKSFKGLFDKAKKKLLKQNGSPEKSYQVQQGSFNTSFEYENNCEIGWWRDHSEYFMTTRMERIERLEGPTSHLLIRLNKLVDNMPSDPIKKKAWEQEKISWVDGTTVTRCPNCTGHFHLARRQHHCRTCGGIMCNNCSHFLPLNTARRIIGKEVESREGGENSSELLLRVCIHCITLLESRERKREMLESCPIMGKIYILLIEARTEAEQHLATYFSMYDSLQAGESKHNLKDAQLLRVRLIKLAESIDSISDKIRNAGMREEGSVEWKLCSGIRTAATSFLCSKLLSLPNLPTEHELTLKQQRRSEKIHEELEKKRNAEMKQRQISLGGDGNSGAQAANGHGQQQREEMVSVGHGWVPTERDNKVNQQDDPIIEQMNIIRSYIKQAQLANRPDEVVSLEQNLQELKMEFWKKQSHDDSTRLEERPDDLDFSPGFDDVGQTET